jgi:hypothetical protein
VVSILGTQAHDREDGSEWSPILDRVGLQHL